MPSEPEIRRLCPLQILVLLIFFQQSIPDAGLQVMGLVLAIIGLTMFLDGLRVAIMVRDVLKTCLVITTPAVGCPLTCCCVSCCSPLLS